MFSTSQTTGALLAVLIILFDPRRRGQGRVTVAVGAHMHQQFYSRLIAADFPSGAGFALSRSLTEHLCVIGAVHKLFPSYAAASRLFSLAASGSFIAENEQRVC